MSIKYDVSIHDADAHLIDVRLEISKPDPQGQLLQLPNWIPGSYMIRDFSRNIVSLRADADNTPVHLEKLDKSTWQAPAGLSGLTLHYRVYAWDLSVRAAHVDRTHAFFNGTSVFLCVVGQESQLHEVTFHRPEQDHGNRFRLATTLSAMQTDESGFGVYQATDYDDLIDHPVEQGDFKRLCFKACGVSHEIVFSGACFLDEARVVDDLTRICEQQIRFFGEPAPFDRYVFLTTVVDSGYGGLEHRSSTALMITRDSLPVPGDKEITDSYLDFLGLCSHEYFHNWNVKRMKPARFIPYELQAESYTRLLWFFEGMTSYYDDLMLVRSGLIDHQRYLSLLAKTLTRVQRTPGRLMQSVTDSSFDAWHKFYKQDENAPNAIVSYYTKGALIGLCMDSLLRRESVGTMSLDTLIKTLWARWLDSAEGMDETEPQRVAEQLLDKDLSAFFEPALYRTDELPLVDSMLELGVRLEWKARSSNKDMGRVRLQPTGEAESDCTVDEGTDTDGTNAGSASPVTPWLGALFSSSPAGVRITHVLNQSPAERAGLAAGDTLLAVNALSVSADNLSAVLARYASTPSVSIHYFRYGVLHDSTLVVESAPQDTAVLTLDDEGKLVQWLDDNRALESAAYVLQS